jgi:thiamine biosynthesis lipoprotein
MRALPFGQVAWLGVFLIACAGARGENTASEPATQWYSECRELYHGLPVQIRFRPGNPRLSKQVWTYLNQVDDIFNDYKSDSEISKINALNSPETVSLSPLLTEAFEKALKAHAMSEGTFDITCAPIRNLWRNTEKEGRVPTAEEVAKVRERCGLNLIELEGNRLSVGNAGVEFDFGGIIKGIIADRVIEMLKKGGAESALVQIGRETAAFGLSPKNRPYRIAIQHPMQRNGTWCVIHNPGLGFSGSTSGSYENPIVIDGKSFYHILDPRTGHPVKSNVVSASIVFPKSGMNWLADTLSTTGVLLGPEKTIKLVQELGGEALFLIRKGNKIHEVKSAGWDKLKL